MRLMRLLPIFLFILIIGQTHAATTPFGGTPLQIDKGKKTTPEFTAKAVIKETPGFQVRVAGYNIAHARGKDSGGLKEIGKPSKLKGIAQLIKDNKIDIVGFTEISRGDLRVLFKNQPKFIAKYLGYHYVYEQNYKRGLFGKLATQGNAIVSKYPIVSHKNHNLYRANDKNEQRSCLDAIIDFGKAGRIRILVAHLSLNLEESTKQIEQIWKIVEASKEPVILTGDFNSRPGSDRVKWLAQRMRDTTSNLNTTYKNKPDVKIDYHFISGPWLHGVSRVIGFDLDYSDHGCLINDYWLQDSKK
ncbi:MAG: endonuclease/exonuclease/phosphatase family protein [Candidatus Riflebacteria bacterium]|nr:endonuclease/exonuclease/phosphatase family protein [Candidatus Riflebacteria bacterium]